ncbi:hypothetical protein PseAD21_01385 [Pseudomonas sp. AD21]|uniref:hypothetical protein n=1 Tax=Pseudomonas sp. AD21 TaxID=396378 RepID=UPI000C8190F9|nr:hypothetical protein [Pseudomonas sp. AD21]PMQ14012.1 hypothetical protein PseAD21_01385 [Pseudomonas sp. AD21]
MKNYKTIILSLFIAATYSGFASAMLSPTVDSDTPIGFNIAEALSEVRPEIKCSVNGSTGVTQCERPANVYTCRIAKKPSLMIYYHSSIATIEEFDKVAAEKGLANCFAGAGF